MLKLLPDFIKLPTVALIAVVIVFYPIRWFGQSEGKRMAATAALSKSVQVLRERNAINDQVSIADATSLCADLGLSDDDKAECVRRVLSPDPEPSDIGNNPQN